MTASVPVADREHVVYRAYNGRGRLLYVGCTSNYELRMRDHRLYSDWFELATKVVIETPCDYLTARAIELAAIHTERPRFNRTGRVANYRPRRVSS